GDDEDPVPFPMAIVSVMVLVLVVRCHLIGTRRVPTRMCLRLRHQGRKVYGGQQGESRGGEQQVFHFSTPYRFERQFDPSDSAAMIQRTAASPLDGGRLIASVTPVGIKA